MQTVGYGVLRLRRLLLITGFGALRFYISQTPALMTLNQTPSEDLSEQLLHSTSVLCIVREYPKYQYQEFTDKPVKRLPWRASAKLLRDLVN